MHQSAGRLIPRPVTWLLIATAFLLGTVMLYVPFYFYSLHYRVVYEHLRLFGVGFTLAGLLMGIAAANVGLPRWAERAGQLLLAVAMIGLTLSVAMPVDLWTRALTLLMLTGALVAVMLLPEREPAIMNGLLIALTLGQGLFMVIVPVPFSPEIYGQMDLLLGLLFLTAGLLLVGVRLWHRPGGLPWWAPLLTVPSFGWYAYHWCDFGSWTGAGLYGVLIAASITWAAYLRRPWGGRVPRLRRRVMVLSVGLAITPVLALGALSVYTVERTEAAAAQKALLNAAYRLAEEAEALSPEVRSDPGALQRALETRYGSSTLGKPVVLTETPADWPSANKGVVQDFSDSGERQYFAFVRQADPSITLVLSRSFPEVFTNAERLSISILIGATTLIFLVAPVGVLLVRRLIRQLNEVKAAAVQLGNQRFGARIDMTGVVDDEVADLANAFNQMAGTLEAYTEEIQAQNEELQAQSEELLAQTEELAAQNEELLAQTDQLCAQNERLRELQHRLHVEHGVAKVLSLSTSLSGALPEMLEAICVSFGWEAAIYWQVHEGEEGRSLRCLDLWHSEQLALSSFVARTRERAFAPGEGLPGHAWAHGQRLSYYDIGTDPRFIRQEEAREAGVAGGLYLQVLTGGVVVGLLEFVTRGILHPTEDWIQTLESVGSQIGQFVERIKVEEQRAKTVALLDTLLDSAPVGFTFLDLEFRYQRINEALARMNGIPVNQHLGRKMAEMVPDLAPQLEPAFRRALATGQPLVNLEISGLSNAHPTEERSYLDSVYPIKLSSGETLGLGLVVTDITEYKRIEQALRQSESILMRQHAILEQIASGAPLLELLQTLATFMEERLPEGYAEILLLDEVGTTLHTIMGSPVSPELAASLVRVSGLPIIGAAGEVLGHVSVLFSKPRALDVATVKLIGNVTHIAAIAIERERWEQSRSQKLHSLIRHMAEGVVAVDAERTLLFINEAALRLLGVEAAAEGEPLQEIGLPQALVHLLEAASSPGSEQVERVTFALDGVEIEAHVSPVFTELSRYGAVAVLQDITSAVQLRRLQEAFVANVSHELRGPLTSVSATLEALHDGIIPQKERERYLKAVLTEMERLRRLSYEVIDLTRLDSGTVQLALESIDLGSVLTGLRDKLSARCSSRGIVLDVSVHSLKVVGDWARVEQVLSNLLDNAVRFTPEGGSITVTTCQEDGMARVTITDTGEGIPQEHLPYIWERFYKVDQARTLTPGTGTGLGLAIVKQLVEIMGGRVSVESRPGEGAAFSFTLPLA